MPLKWEDIDSYHKRAKVPLGWLVKSYEDVFTTIDQNMLSQTGYEFRIAMCFMPDPDHEWEP